MNDIQRLNDFSKLMNPCSLSLDFVEWLSNVGFFTAPAHTKGRGAFAGGLYDHSKAVAISLSRLTDGLKLEWQRPESPLIIGMFHELYKVGLFREVIDDEGVVMFGEEEPQRRVVHYELDDPILKGYGEKSIMHLSKFMTLTPEEVYCIRFHSGPTPRDGADLFGRAIELFPNVLFTYTAYMMAPRLQGV